MYVSAVSLPLALWGQVPQSEEVVELSPFVVDSEQNTGYSANSTLAGTRIRTSLEDVGSSITAITDQFLEDTGSTNLNDVLIYTANTESGTVGGNYSATFARGDASGQGFRSGETSVANPQAAQRIRGLASADVTRNLFRSTVPVDDYNVSQVEIVRGANSILFGQGSPGGIINSNLIRPYFRDAHEVKFRFDDQDSIRTTLDSNLVLVDDVLAIRLAALNERHNYRQKPAFEDDDRIYLAAEWKIARGLTLRMNGEKARIRANRPDPTAPIDGFSFYLNNAGLVTDPTVLNGDEFRGDVVVDGQVLQSNVIYGGDARFFAQWGIKLETDGTSVAGSPAASTIRQSMAPNNILPGNAAGIPVAPRTVRFSRAAYELALGAGLLPNSLSDYSVFDWKNNYLAGDFPFQNQDFRTFQTALEFVTEDGNFGVEFAYDKQKENSHIHRGLTFSRDYVIRLDLSEQNLDGSPNPHYLRPVIALSQNVRKGNVSEFDNDTVQVSAFGRFSFERDAGWQGTMGRLLGNHSVTLFASRNETGSRNVEYDKNWVGPNIERNANNGLTANSPPGNPLRDGIGVVYLGPRLLDANSVSIDRLRFSADDYYANGSTYTVNVWDKASQTFVDLPYTSLVHPEFGGGNDQKTDTMAAILQSNFWDNHITTVAGVRRDKTTSRRVTFASLPGTTGILDLDNPSFTDTSGSGDYFSWSVVARSPRNWSLPLDTRFNVFFSKSENFDPSDTGRVTPLGEALSPTTGNTQDYGIRFTTLNDRLELKVNFFETSLDDQSFTAGSLVRSAVIEIDTRFREFTFVRGVNDGYLNPNDPVVDSFGTPPAATLAQLGASLLPDGTYTFSGLGRITDTTSSQAEGMEIEAVFNPTRNWRMIFNLSRQETVRSESLAGLQEYIAARLPSWETAFKYPFRGLAANEQVLGPDGFLDVDAFAAAFPQLTRQAEYDRVIRIPLQAILDQDGGAVDEQREWRFNLVTNYTFEPSSPLGGFNVGGALRWQDRAAIGNPFTVNEDGQTIVDVKNPFRGPSSTHYDAWVGYNRKIWNNKVDWRIQLNARNVFADDDPLPISIDAFGRVAQYMVPPLTTWTITNTFRF